MQPMWQLLSTIIAFARDDKPRDETRAIAANRLKRVTSVLNAFKNRINRQEFAFVEFLVL